MSSARLAIAIIVVVAATVTLVASCKKKTPAPTPPGKTAATQPVAPDGSKTAPPATPVKLPSYWVSTDVDKNWPGKHWSKIDLFSFIKVKPTGLDTGTKYVTFFGRTCEHCEEMFNADLATDPGLAELVTAIEVPVETDKLRGENPWALPATKCNFGELRLGPNWIMTTPVTVRLVDGIVECAQEGGHRECMGLE